LSCTADEKVDSLKEKRMSLDNLPFTLKVFLSATVLAVFL
jgi:hypothetical protein